MEDKTISRNMGTAENRTPLETVGKTVLSGFKGFDGEPVEVSGEDGTREVTIGGSGDLPVDDTETLEAVGYLATWSLSRFPFASIFVDKNLEMTAAYRREEAGPVGYVIGAVPLYHEDGRFKKYSFHS